MDPCLRFRKEPQRHKDTKGERLREYEFRLTTMSRSAFVSLCLCGSCYHFNKLLRSTFSDSRLRNIAITSARPTAASAAATTSTKNTKTCPLINRCSLENATN